MFEFENPADKLLEESEIDQMISSEAEINLKKYIGEKYDNGFTIDEKMALTIIRTYAPEKELKEVVSYTLMTIGKTTMLIGRDVNDIVVITVEMPKDVEPILAAPNYEDTLQSFKDDTALYRKVRWTGYITIAILIALSIGAMWLIMKYR